MRLMASVTAFCKAPARTTAASHAAQPAGELLSSGSASIVTVPLASWPPYLTTTP